MIDLRHRKLIFGLEISFLILSKCKCHHECHKYKIIDLINCQDKTKRVSCMSVCYKIHMVTDMKRKVYLDLNLINK